MTRSGLTRREILQGGGIAAIGAGGLTLAGLTGYAWPHDQAAAAEKTPAAAARVNPAGGSVVYASWNGATEVTTWTVLAGTKADSLARIGSQRRSGFETMIAVNAAGPYFAVQALDAGSHVLGRSPTVRVLS